jgi:ribonuclease VapC
LIVDSSALVAAVLREPDGPAVLARLAEARAAAIGAPTLVETAIVIESRLGAQGRTLLGHALASTGVATLAFDAEHARVAADAFRRYGKGRHPAGLNYGDCMTYATARVAGEPLLALGDDFAATDLDLVPR